MKVDKENKDTGKVSLALAGTGVKVAVEKGRASGRRHVPGRVVRSLDELVGMKEGCVFYGGRCFGLGWVLGWQLQYALNAVRSGKMRVAVERRTGK